MAIALKGKISAVPLVDLMRFLSGLKTTGELQLKGPRGQGSLYLEDGRLVHATINGTEGTEAFLTLVLAEKGNFTLESTASAEEHSIDEDIGKLLKTGEQKITEWQEINKAVPHFDLVFRMCPRPEAGEIRLAPEEWQIVSQIDGAKSVQEIKDNLGLAANEIVKTISRLTDNGLIEATEGDPENDDCLTPELVTSIHSELASRIGPIASLIIEDISEELGYDLKHFPVKKMEQFLERLTEEIPNPAQQETFQKATSALIDAS